MPVTIAFQYQYEACALMFLLVIAFRFFSVRRFPSRQNSLFGVILLCAAADLALDVAGSFLIVNANAVPLWVNYAVNTAFYALQAIFPPLMMTYVIYCSGRTYRKRKPLLLLLLPTAFILFLLALNPLTGWFFAVKPVNGALVYCRGKYFPTLYAGTAFYMGATLWLVHCYRADLDGKQRRTVAQFMGLLAAALVVQYLFPAVLLTGVAMVLAILLMFFILQNPDDMLDIISGVFNYNAMMILLQSKINHNERLRVIAVDVGGIRRINSTFGLIVGNRFFSLFGDFLNQLPGEKWVFRLVGTRFLVLVTQEADYLAAINEIKDRFEREWVVDGKELRLTATIRHFDALGVFESPQEVVGLIDETYAAISSGNWGQCEAIDQQALVASHRRTQVESAMRAALQKGEGFTLYYQPIFYPKGGGFPTAEALLRFDSPELGRISPAEFIPIAEKSGLFLQIDELVIRMACDFMRRHPEMATLEINLSASEFFRDPTTRIHDIVKKCGVAPARLCFEVTETAADVYPAMLARFMKRMIDYGYHFALDDFGTGYSNIAKVANLPFSIAKIDRVLLEDEKKIRVLFDSLARMFANIGVRTVVEGVETPAQAELVSDKVDFIQGFLYAVPMPEEELTAFYQTRQRGEAPALNA